MIAELTGSGESAPVLSYSPRLAERFTPVTFDLEFGRLPKQGETLEDWSRDVLVVSAGLHAPALRPGMFYAALRPSWLLTRRCAPWTIENVLPLVPAAAVDDWCRNATEMAHVLLRYQVEIERQTHKPCVLISNWLGDAFLIRHLLGRLAPVMAVCDLRTDHQWQGSESQSWAGLTRHNALDDARWLSRVLGLSEG